MNFHKEKIMADLWGAAKGILGAVAPTLGAALGGPMGGIAAKTIATILLGDEAADESKIAAAVAGATPDQLLLLKKANLDFEVKMRELEVDIKRIEMDDRKSARDREAAIKDWTPRILAALIIGGFLTSVYMVLAGLVEGLKDPVMSGIVGTLIGYVSAKADQVVSYYFGSSAGSDKKTEAMQNAMERGLK